MAKEKNVERKLTDSFRGFVAAFLFVALAGCGGLKDDTGTEEVPDEPKTGAVKIITTSTDKLQPISQSLQASVADGPSLTRVPVPTGVNFDYEYWILRGSVDDYDSNDAIDAAAKSYRPDTLGGDTITLTTGNYTLKVKAFPYGTLFDPGNGNKIIDANGMYAGSDSWTDDTAATQAAKGETTLNITPGTTTKITLALAPSGLSGGTGDFIYTITRPTGTNITLELGLLGITGNLIPGTITPGEAESTTGTDTIKVSNAANNKSTARNIAAGSYGFRIKITSTDNVNLVTGWWETVQIYRGMQTLLDIEFDWGDFVDISDGTGMAGVGTGPTGITIGNIPGNPDDFTIAWYDGNEKEYHEAVEIDQSKSGYVIAKGPPSGYSDFQWYLQGYNLTSGDDNPFDSVMYSIGSTQITLYNTLPVGHYYLTLSAKHTTDNTYYSTSSEFTVINPVKDWAKANLGETSGGEWVPWGYSVSGSIVTLKGEETSASFTLKNSITVDGGITLVIPEYCTLNVPAGKTLIAGATLGEDGKITAAGTLTVKGIIDGGGISGGTIDVGTIDAAGKYVSGGGDIVIESGGKINAKTTKGKGTLKVMKGGTLITDYGDGTTLVEIVSGTRSADAQGMLLITGDNSYVKFSHDDGFYHFAGKVTLQNTFVASYTDSTDAPRFRFDTAPAGSDNILTITTISGYSYINDGTKNYSGILMRREGTVTGLTADDFFTSDTASGTINITHRVSGDGAGFWDAPATCWDTTPTGTPTKVNAKSGGKITVNWPSAD